MNKMMVLMIFLNLFMSIFSMHTKTPVELQDTLKILTTKIQSFNQSSDLKMLVEQSGRVYFESQRLPYSTEKEDLIKWYTSNLFTEFVTSKAADLDILHQEYKKQQENYGETIKNKRYQQQQSYTILRNIGLFIGFFFTSISSSHSQINWSGMLAGVGSFALSFISYKSAQKVITKNAREIDAELAQQACEREIVLFFLDKLKEQHYFQKK